MRKIEMIVVLATLALSFREGRAEEPANQDNEELSDEDRQLLAESLAAIGDGDGDGDGGGGPEVIVIEPEAAFVPVSERSVRDRDLELRPHPRPADLLRVVPGVFVNQHSGGGKANQYFLRGFDADHGTDIALSFDGVPANMVSHGHGQGYTDLNWVIPEVVTSVDTFKGPYSARLGDFATAGAIDLVAHERISRSSVSMTSGRFGAIRGLGMLTSDPVRGWRPLAAVEVAETDGPFENDEDYRRYSTYTHVERELGDSTWLKLAATSYMGAWNGSGQLPLREVAADRLDRFGTLDATEGGRSQRHSVYAKLHSYPDSATEIKATAYLVRYKLNLFSNFTFFSNDPEAGDQIEQEDDRVYAGAKASARRAHRLGPFEATSTVGLEWRGDAVSTGLWDTTERERRMRRVDAEVLESSLSAYGQQDVVLAPWLRSVVGLRLDHFTFDVEDNLGDGSGHRRALRVGPKASLVATPTRGTDIFVNAGIGFHSNDARAVVREDMPGTPLTRAAGTELGARSKLGDSVDVAGSLWMLDLDNEIVWVGDEGSTESRGRTRRMGVELEGRARLTSWLTADADVTISRARFRDEPEGADRVPLAPSLTFTAGLSALHPSGAFGRLGARGLSDRPLTEDSFLVAEGFTLFDLTAGYRTARYELSLAIDNVLDTRWREAQFATTSRVAGEPSPSMPLAGACPGGTRAQTNGDGGFAGCEDVHFTPGSPFNAMLTAKLFF